MDGDDLASVPSAARWGTAGQIGGQVLRFVALLVLARLLGRGEVGLLEMALVVIGFVEVIRSVGTSEFLIREPDLPPRLLSTVFVVNVAAGCCLSALLWFGAGLVGRLFRDPGVGPLTAWLGLGFVVLSFGNVHEALLRREMHFKRLAAVLVCGPLAYAGAAIPAALAGWREMSFVAGGLAEAVTVTLLLWAVSGWRPRAGFAWSEARKAFHFSFFLTGSEVVRWLTSMADRLLIGRALGRDAVGVYGLARRLLIQVGKPLLLVYSKVVLPALAQVQGDAASVRRRYVRACASIALIAFPAMAGICVLAGPLIGVVDADKWGPAIPLIRIFSVVAALQVVASTVGVLYMVANRTDRLFLWSLVSGAAILGGYAAGMGWGVEGVAVASAVVMLLLFVPAFAIPFRLVGIRLRDLFAALGPSVLVSLLMAAAVWAVRALLEVSGSGPALVLAVSTAAGTAVYLVLLRRLQPPGLENLLEVLPSTLTPLLRPQTTPPGPQEGRSGA